MTWLAGAPEAGTDWEALAARCPEPMEALADLVRAAWADTDPVLLELARLRIAALLGDPAAQARRTGRATEAGLSDDKVAALAQWPTSPLFSETERAGLALTEQFVIDANSVTDRSVADLADQLGPEASYAFVQAVSALETVQRACLTLGLTTVPDLVPPQPAQERP